VTSKYRLFATTPKQLESLLAEELRQLGAEEVSETPAGVHFQGDLRIAYRICLFSRLANRVLLIVATFPVSSTDDLYDHVKTIEWSRHMDTDSTFAVDLTEKRSDIGHTKFAALRVKDAIVDQFREEFGVRPSVSLERPNVRLNAHIDRRIAQVSLDLSGESLHRRGYRSIGVVAPLKENLAAAILLRGGWPDISQKGGGFIDPMCGSGTLVIEAAMMAGDIAPGLMRDYFGFLGWKGHDLGCWEELKSEAETRKSIGLEKLPPIIGYDEDKRAIVAAWANVEKAGLQGYVHIEKKVAFDIEPLQSLKGKPGLIAVNPPYGKRIGETQGLRELFRQFGATLKQKFVDWQAVVLIEDSELGFQLGIRSKRPYTLYNGTIECKLLKFSIDEDRFFEPKETDVVSQEDYAGSILRKAWCINENQLFGSEMFANRLKKNSKNLDRWARREDVDCYRLYDADLPEYAVAIDLYQGKEKWVHVQEYKAPLSVDAKKAEQRLISAISYIPKVLKIPQKNIFLKIRTPQRGKSQYSKLADTRRFFQVREGQCQLLVNFQDYLDTGLFLDHRRTREMISEMAVNKRFLNLFGYTGSATVHAALGGAKSTTTVDLSNMYLSWAKNNLFLNQIKGEHHRLIQANCLNWIEEATQNKFLKGHYDLIFLDPPTFSNSSNMDTDFDLQRDHSGLIQKVMKLLSSSGLLMFSTNSRKFRMDEKVLKGFRIEDISRSTIPEDFSRKPKIHYCWKIKNL